MGRLIYVSCLLEVGKTCVKHIWFKRALHYSCTVGLILLWAKFHQL